MRIESLTRLTFDPDEVAALYEVCASALEANILDGHPLAFALAIVESMQEVEDEAVDQEEGVTLQ